MEKPPLDMPPVRRVKKPGAQLSRFPIHKRQTYHNPKIRTAAATTAAANEPRPACGVPPVDVEELDEPDVAFPPDAGLRGAPVLDEASPVDPVPPAVLVTL